MRSDDGVRVPIKIGMHVLMCWLHGGDAPNGRESPVVLHDPLTCRHSWCLGLQCLSWGDAVDNVRDRQRALLYRQLQAGLGGQEARVSERLCILHSCCRHPCQLCAGVGGGAIELVARTVARLEEA